MRRYLQRPVYKYLQLELLFNFQALLEETSAILRNMSLQKKE